VFSEDESHFAGTAKSQERKHECRKRVDVTWCWSIFQTRVQRLEKVGSPTIDENKRECRRNKQISLGIMVFSFCLKLSNRTHLWRVSAP